MRNKTEESLLRFRETPFTALVITVLSLFCQFMNWYAYEKIGYGWGITLVTPLLLCVMYHFVQLDGGSDSFSRRFFFIFSVVIPLLTGIILTVIMVLAAPDISVFSPEAQYRGTVRETIATYAGRFIFTSMYLLIFSAFDIALLKAHDRKRKKM